MKSLRFSLAPVLLSIHPVLFLYARNLGEIGHTQITRSLIAAVSLTLTMLIFSRIFLRSWLKATLFASIFVFMFLTFGHLQAGLISLLATVNKQLLRWIAFALWMILLFSGSIAVYRSHRIEATMSYVSVVAVVMILIPGSEIVMFHNRERSAIEERNSSSLPIVAHTDATMGSKLPDIYYIIVDAYGRSDVIRELYDYDNSDFTSYLEQQGFFVAEDSVANYNRTVLSVASSLDLEYINYLTDLEGRDSTNYEIFAQMIQDSRVHRYLETIGYETVTISSGFWATEIEDVDIYLASEASFNNEFERTLILTTPLTLIPGIGKFLSYEAHRQRVLFAADTLVHISQEDSQKPRFVFSHILSPHPPFVFGPNGEELTPDHTHYTLRDGNEYLGTQAEYIMGYRGQLQYLNQLLEASIGQILQNSKRPPIIVIQGDHGPGAYTDFYSADDSCHYERSSILNAIYAPNLNRDLFYESMSPVNSLRVLFNQYLGTDMQLLEDRSYFGPTPHILDLVDISDRVDSSQCYIQ